MSPQVRRWSPEKIEAMRNEIVEDGTTLDQIGEREGVTGERIRQLVGPIPRNRTELRRKKVHDLVIAGHDDAEIAKELGISVRYVAQLRCESGIYHPHPLKKWSCLLIIEAAWRWFEVYGYTASAIDWNPATLKRLGQLERLERFYAFGAPTTAIVQKYFDRWSEMIRQSQLPPPESGHRGHGRWQK